MAREVDTAFNPAFQGSLEKLRAAAEAQGIHTHLISGVRSTEDQRQLYANMQAGRAGKPLPYPDRGPVPTAAKPGTSLHERGLAADLEADDPRQQAALRALGPQFGLKTLGPRDPNHFELAKGTMINASIAPVAGALAKQEASPENVGSGVLSPLDLVAHFESGDRNIPQEIKDRNSAAGTPAQGHFQIIDPTWTRYAGAAGVDLKKYPSAISAPREVQAKVASVIPVREWGHNTKKELLAAYPWIDVNKPLGDAQAAALKNAGGETAAPAPAPADDRPWWDKAYGKLVSTPEGGGKSPMEQFQETLARGQANQKAAMEAQAPSDPGFGSQGPGARNVSPGLANIAQTYGQTLDSFSQPPTWSSAPPGAARAGSQTWATPVPGLSLSSVQTPSLGLGYGIEPAGYGYG